MKNNMSWDALEQRLYEMASPNAPLGLAFLKTVINKIGASCNFPAIHIAGTNGKGSTSACCDAILRAQGYSTALFTSPHLSCIGERLLLNGKMLPAQEWHSAFDLIEEVLKEEPEGRLSFFSIITAAAFLLIKRHDVDISILETGLGGTYDGTNVIEKPLLSLITPLGMDHMAILGDTIEKIAESKFGIIKRGCKALYCGSPEKLNGRFKNVCEALGALGEVFSDSCKVECLKTSLEGTSFVLSSGKDKRELFVRLPGLFQSLNASLAVRALELISDTFPVSCEAVSRGLATVLWPGRMEVLRRDPDVMIDGAHNPHATKALINSLREIYGSSRPISFVFAAMRDKDYRTSLSMLCAAFPNARLFCCTVDDVSRAEKLDVLLEKALSLPWKRKPRAMSSAKEAINCAVAIGEPVMICGSLYLIGEVRDMLSKSPAWC